MILLLFIMLICSNVYSANHYILQGSVGDGNSWSNAFGSLPDILVRGDTYYLGNGVYPGYIFNDALSGTDLITIKKAVNSDHGTDLGWSASYGEGQAIFAPVIFNTGYYLIDGITGGGPENWTNNFGIRIKADGINGNTYLTTFGAAGSNITFRHIDIGNDVWPEPGCDCIVYSANGADNVSFSYCYLHNTGDVGFKVFTASGWLWEYCRVDKVSRYGQQTECGSGINHGAGWEFSGSGCSNIIIRNNIISDISGTGWIGIYESVGLDGGMVGLYIYNNIFFNTLGFTNGWGNGVIYNQSAVTGPLQNVKIYNNTFANLIHYTILGLSIDIGGSRENLTSYGNEFVNNVVWNVTGAPSYDGGETRNHNASDQDIPNDSDHITLMSSPFADSVNSDFTILKSSPLIDVASNLSSYFTIDITGRTRGSQWDIGAYEYYPIAPPQHYRWKAAGP